MVHANPKAKLALVNTLFPLLIAVLTAIALIPGADEDVIKAGTTSLHATLLRAFPE